MLKYDFLKVCPASTVAVIALAGILSFSACSSVQMPPFPPDEQQDFGKDDDADSPQSRPSAGEYTLQIMETSDIHGHIIGAKDGVIQYYLSFIADKVEDVRCGNQDRLLLLDGGDIYQGASISNLLGGRPVYISFDKMGYDAVAVGNHEFDWDITTLVDGDATLPDYEWDGRQYTNLVPVLCANLFLGGSRVPFTKDYVIVHKTAFNSKGESVSVKIGIIGFAVNYSRSIMQSKFLEKGYSIREDYSIANNIAAELEGSGQCDATILLIHGDAGSSAEQLGRRSAIDLVLGGHSHRAVAGTADSGIAYLQGGRYAEHYACSELVFEFSPNPEKLSFKNVGKQKIMDVSGDLSGKDEQEFDRQVLEVSDRAVSATEEQMNDVIGFITYNATTYYLSGSGGRVSVMSNWISDIIRRIGQADVSFVNSGGIRTSFPLGGLSRRDIRVSDVYEMFPFSNATYVYEITYADLLQLLEYSLTKSGASLFTCVTGIDCFYSGQSVISLEKNGSVIYSGGRWADDWESQTLSLAVSEFLATSEGYDRRTGLTNPLLQWNNSSRLICNSGVDNEDAIMVLRDEAARSGGHLYIDSKPHFIEVD